MPFDGVRQLVPAAPTEAKSVLEIWFVSFFLNLFIFSVFSLFSLKVDFDGNQ